MYLVCLYFNLKTTCCINFYFTCVCVCSFPIVFIFTLFLHINVVFFSSVPANLANDTGSKGCFVSCGSNNTSNKNRWRVPESLHHHSSLPIKEMECFWLRLMLVKYALRRSLFRKWMPNVPQ